jgi:hypothetical protein
VTNSQRFLRTFKEEVLKTNHRKATEILLKRECRQQTIHLILSGAYRTSHVDLTQCFQQVNIKCPTLLRYLRIPGTRSDCAQDSDVESQEIEDDNKHRDAAAQIRIHPKSLKLLSDPLLGVRTIHNLPSQHEFPKLLQSAYLLDYNVSNVITFDNQIVRWARRLRFTDP